jgi:hypothetical protein
VAAAGGSEGRCIEDGEDCKADVAVVIVPVLIVVVDGEEAGWAADPRAGVPALGGERPGPNHVAHSQQRDLVVCCPVLICLAKKTFNLIIDLDLYDCTIKNSLCQQILGLQPHLTPLAH